MSRVKNTTHISIALSLDEVAAINAKAKEAGLSRNAWLRTILGQATGVWP